MQAPSQQKTATLVANKQIKWQQTTTKTKEVWQPHTRTHKQTIDWDEIIAMMMIASQYKAAYEKKSSHRYIHMHTKHLTSHRWQRHRHHLPTHKHADTRSFTHCWRSVRVTAAAIVAQLHLQCYQHTHIRITQNIASTCSKCVCGLMCAAATAN